MRGCERCAAGAAHRPRLLCVGSGFTARRLAAQLRGRFDVLGTARSPGEAQQLRDAGMRPVLLSDITDAEDLLLGCHVLASIPPVPGDCPDPVLEAHAGAFRRAASSLSWVAYLSTTSVYGDADGAEVDEQSPVDASSPKAASRLRAEAAWLALHEEYGVPVHVFRLGGIYGPGRSALDAARSAAKGAVSDNQRRRAQKRFTSRVNVDDICQTLVRSITLAPPGEVWNVVDDDPAPRSEVLAYAASLLGLPAPQRTPQAGAGAGAADKRVSNGKIKKLLQVALLYPSYREGLRSVLAEEAQSDDRVQ